MGRVRSVPGAVGRRRLGRRTVGENASAALRRRPGVPLALADPSGARGRSDGCGGAVRRDGDRLRARGGAEPRVALEPVSLRPACGNAAVRASATRAPSGREGWLRRIQLRQVVAGARHGAHATESSTRRQRIFGAAIGRPISRRASRGRPRPGRARCRCVFEPMWTGSGSTLQSPRSCTPRARDPSCSRRGPGPRCAPPPTGARSTSPPAA